MLTRHPRALALALAAPLLALTAGCDDVRAFAGSWQGAVSGDPVLRQGFASGDSLSLDIAEVTRDRLTLTARLPGAAESSVFSPIDGAAGDALGDMRLPGEPLRTYLGYLDAGQTGAGPYLAFVSLFQEGRVDVRLVRGSHDAYAVFSLRRSP